MDNSIKIVPPNKARKRPNIEIRRKKEESAKIRSPTKSKMRRHISPDNPVRRRLFMDEDDDITSEARTDNFSNSIQEDIKREILEKSLKWNFDFGNETPLEGPYEWTKRDGDTWVAIKPGADEASVMKSVNETTPRRQSDESVRMLRKRKREERKPETESVAVRRITF